MQTLHKRALLLFPGMMLLLLLNACTVPGASGNSAADVLNKSAQAMQKLTSANFAFDASLTSNLGSLLPSGSDSTSSQTPSGSDLTITLKGNGQVQFPDQSALNLQLHVPTAGQGQDTQLSAVIKDKKLYFKGNDGQWYVASPNTSNTFLGSTQVSNYSKLLNLTNKARITDHGTQSRNGENLRHITLAFDKAELNDVLNQVDLTSSLSTEQQQLLTSFMDKLTLKTLSLDTWIDEATSYIHHLDFTLDLSLDLGNLVSALGQNSKSGTSSALSSLPSTVNVKLALGFDLSKFNQPVTITAPSNAIPTNDSTKIFAH